MKHESVINRQELETTLKLITILCVGTLVAEAALRNSVQCGSHFRSDPQHTE